MKVANNIILIRAMQEQSKRPKDEEKERNMKPRISVPSRTAWFGMYRTILAKSQYGSPIKNGSSVG